MFNAWLCANDLRFLSGRGRLSSSRSRVVRLETELVLGSFDSICAAVSYIPDVSTTSVRICGTTETIQSPSSHTKTILRDPNVFTGNENDRAVGKGLRYSGAASCSPGNPCGECVGHCSTNEDCKGSLECFTRSDGNPEMVPGCSYGGFQDVPSVDYCFDPKATTTAAGLLEGWEGRRKWTFDFSAWDREYR